MAATVKVLLVGGTGMVGREVLKALTETGRCAVRAAYRPGKSDDAGRLRAAGAEPVEADLMRPDTLPAVCAGVDVVVSTVWGDESLVVGGQQNLVRAADAAGVRRMIPSDYAIDMTKLDDGDNAYIDWRRRADREFDGRRVKPTPVLNGAFMHFLAHPQFGPVDWSAGEFRTWGDGEQACDYTTVADTARYTAAAVLDGDLTGRPLRVAGAEVTMRQLHAAYERTAGRKLKFTSLGTLDELRARIAERVSAGAAIDEYVMLQYQWCMLTGKAKLSPLDNNRYPDIRPTGVDQYLRDYLPGDVRHG